ncbi:hypothetical protein [Streptomyces sp. NPDC001568]|uniref:hypothetical protein n=1 Tax=Streptomyces sp. NPDC001568 TaxID=3364588 RepID=UPI0036D0E887
MRITRTLATAGLTLATLGLAGTASIASAAPVTTNPPTVSAAAPTQGAHSGGQVLALTQGGCPLCLP